MFGGVEAQFDADSSSSRCVRLLVRLGNRWSADSITSEHYSKVLRFLSTVRFASSTQSSLKSIHLGTSPSQGSFCSTFTTTHLESMTNREISISWAPGIGSSGCHMIVFSCEYFHKCRNRSADAAHRFIITPSCDCISQYEVK